MRHTALAALGLAALAALPLALPASWTVVLAKMLIAAVFALGFNLLAGRAGMLSFGHAAYLALGAFATVHAMRAVEHGLTLPTPLLPLVGMFTGLLVGAACGAIAAMRSGVYFSMITLAIAELLYSIAPSLMGTFGGEGGLTSIRAPSLVSPFGSDLSVYYLVAAWAVLAGAALHAFGLTPLGRLGLALRDSEQRARFLGFHTYHTRVAMFAVSAMFAGLSGSLAAVVDESANYTLFDTGLSAAVVLNTFIGGSGVFLGPALGAMLLTAFAYLVSDLTQMVLFYEGVLFILVMVFVPQGLCGLLADQRRPLRLGWWRQLVLPYAAMAPAAAAVLLPFIFVTELLQRFFSPDEVIKAKLGSRALPVPFMGPPMLIDRKEDVAFMGQAWDVSSPLTWAVPAAIALGGALLLRRAAGAARAVWSANP